MNTQSTNTDLGLTGKAYSRKATESPMKAITKPRQVTRDRDDRFANEPTNMTADTGMTYQDYAEMRESRNSK